MRKDTVPTESSPVWEDILKLRRAFKAAIRKCERARDEREQKEAIRELWRLTRRLTKTAKTLTLQQEYEAKFVQIVMEMTEDIFRLSKSPVLSKFPQIRTTS
jgi:hypothetical protein